jgi:hypothetical protein
MIITELINHQEYEKLMRESITKVYKQLYTTSISNFDLDYIFSYFKSKCYPQNFTDLNSEIVGKYEETEEFNSSLNTVFNKVLMRDADNYEKIKYINLYRHNTLKNKKETEVTISDEIYNSLEYQMVLKDKIIELYQEVKGHTTISPSIVYKLLETILGAGPEVKRDQNKIKEIISTYEY